MKLQIGIDGKNYEVDVEVLEEDSTIRTLGPASRQVVAPKPPVSASPKPTHRGSDTLPDNSKVCRSPVAGVVLRLSVQPGQTVQANDPLLVLEAMKMETNLTAPSAGIVKSLLAQPGDAVKVGQVLVELE